MCIHEKEAEVSQQDKNKQTPVKESDLATPSPREAHQKPRK
jgi:hypothetical protein